MKTKLIPLVFAGGALGTLLRYLLSELTSWFVVDQNAFSFNTGWYAVAGNASIFDPGSAQLETLSGIIALTLVNALGAAALGWFNGDRRFQTDARRAFWSIGFAGGFTTMSGLFVWLVFVAQFETTISLLALAISVILSWLAHVNALKIAQKWRG